MNNSETRFLFWDGSTNVADSDGSIDGAISCKGLYLLDTAPAADRPVLPANARVLTASEKAQRDREVKTFVESGIVVPAPKVSIKRVDPGFTPLEQLLAIELRLRFVPRIRQLMLLVTNRAGKLVYLERLSGSEVARLPLTDISVDGNGAKKPDWKNSVRKRADAGMPGDRFTMSIWIAERAGVFDQCSRDSLPPKETEAEMVRLGKIDVWAREISDDQAHAWVPPERAEDSNPRIELFTPKAESLDDFRKTMFYKHWQAVFTDWPAERLQLWRDRTIRKMRKHADAMGKNMTVASTLIEDILASRTKLKFHDAEPAGETTVYKGTTKVGTGKTFPEFLPLIREALYDICACSAIGMALLDAVASGPHSVDVYPVGDLFDSLGGTIATAELKDAGAVEGRVAAVKKQILEADPALFSGPAWTAHGDQLKPEDFRLVSAAEKRKYEAACKEWKLKDDAHAKDAQKPAPGPEPAKPAWTAHPAADYAARKIVYCGAGASDGKGCPSHFYFNVRYMKQKFLGDQYTVYYMETVGQPLEQELEILKDKKYVARIENAVPVVFGVGSDNINVSIETPLFTAILHELVHARRLQCGINAEWDEIRDANPHPKSMIGRMNTAKVKKVLVSHFASRYNGEANVFYSREEYDTIEGFGAPIAVPEGSAVAKLAEQLGASLHEPLVVPSGSKVKELRVTENLIRKEVGIDLRFRYVEGQTMLVNRDDARRRPKPFRIRRKYLKASPIDAFKVLPTRNVKFADMVEQASFLIKEGSGLTKAALKLEPEQTCFVMNDDRLALAFLLKDVAGAPVQHLDAKGKKSLEDIYKSLTKQWPYIYQNISETSAKLFAGIPNDSVPENAAALDKQRTVARLIKGMIAIENPRDLATIINELCDPASGARTMRENLADRACEAVAGLNHLTVDPASDLDGSTVLLGKVDKLGFCTNSKLRREINQVHMFLHEPMHCNSWNAGGFNGWDLEAGSELTKNIVKGMGKAGNQESAQEQLEFNIKGNLDEGTTEMLARIATYRLNLAAGRIVSEVELFGGLLSYHYVTHVVCNLVHDMDAALGKGEGMKRLLGAYFGGKWDRFNQAIEAALKSVNAANTPEERCRYGTQFWWRVALLEKGNAPYLDPTSKSSRAVQDLRETFGIAMEDAAGAAKAITEGRYVDPVLWLAKVSGSGVTDFEKEKDLAKYEVTIPLKNHFAPQ